LPATSSAAVSTNAAAPAGFDVATVKSRARRVLALLSDAYGGHGGIASFNRDMLDAICSSGDVRQVVVLPRIAPDAIGALPDKVSLKLDGLGGKPSYVRAVARLVANGAGADVVICGHINLLPIAALASRWLRAPLVLVIHGTDAWTPHRSWLTRRLAAWVNLVVAVSALTRDRFLAWTDRKPPVSIVPNVIRLRDFGPGPAPAALLDRHGLRGRTVLLTLGRLAADERCKGFDEVIAALPQLAAERPDIAYLIVGDGSDRARLQALAREHAVADRVIFAGRIPEAEKADHYRLAHAYVMPSRGEGFGRVYHEALACGIPVVASSTDGGREAVLDGELGVLVNPADPADVLHGIRAALAQGRSGVPPRLRHFAVEENAGRWQRLLDTVLG